MNDNEVTCPGKTSVLEVDRKGLKTICLVISLPITVRTTFFFIRLEDISIIYVTQIVLIGNVKVSEVLYDYIYRFTPPVSHVVKGLFSV